MNADNPAPAPVITVDGPGGSGKGTIAMRLAEKLGWHFLDSGALYRLVAVAAMDRGIEANAEQALGEVAGNLDVTFGISDEGMVILLDGNYITGRLRSDADGRDMGTVIFPDAILKIFLTASAEARAERRYKQLKEKGESVNLSRLFRDIKMRDERDSSRAVAPLRPAPDAHVIDSTELGINEVLQVIDNLLDKISVSN